MKKIFIALSALAALVLGVVPAQALPGIPDRVHGAEVLAPFWVVSYDGTLDTLISVQDSGTDPFSTEGASPDNGYRFHYIVYDRTSVERHDAYRTYTSNDVETWAVGAGILFVQWDVTNPVDLAALDTMFGADLDADGVNDHYVGYMNFENQFNSAGTGWAMRTANTLAGKTYVVNLTGGIGAGVSAASREYLPNDPTGVGSIAYTNDYNYWQKEPAAWAGGVPSFVAATSGALEAFSPAAYAVSEGRVANRTVPALIEGTSASDIGNMGYFELDPRWFLYTQYGENTLFVWKSRNTNGTLTVSDSWDFTINYFNNAEVPVSRLISLPYELNIINVRDALPASYRPVGDAMEGGWIQIRFPAAAGTIAPCLYWEHVDFLAYSWQRANNTDASLNWAALFEVHRTVGTIIIDD